MNEGAKVNKLSRKRPARRRDFDSSGDDFADDLALPPPSSRPKLSKENLPPPKITQDESDPVLTPSGSQASLPDCPFCGKGFPGTSEKVKTTRIGHLKACGTKKGYDAAKLLKVRQLEEKQAEERKALGLPSLPAAAAASKTNESVNVTQRNVSTRSNKSTRSSKKALPTTGDAQLEMALALSASLAQSKVEKEQDEQDALKRLGLTELEPTEKKMAAVAPPAIILPNLAAEETKPTKRKGSRHARTALEVRRPEDRERQISEQVGIILAGQSSSSHFKSEVFRKKEWEFSDEISTSDTPELWKAAGGKEEAFLCEFMTKYVETSKATTKPNRPTTPAKCNRSAQQEKGTSDLARNNQPLEKLSQDLEKLLESGEGADLTIFTKDEGSIAAHSVILMARCRDALREVLDEEADGKVQKILSWSSVTKEAATVFLVYIYASNLREIERLSTYEGVKFLCQQFRVKELEKLLVSTVKKDFLVDHETEEEEERANWLAENSNNFEAGPEPALENSGFFPQDESFNIFGEEEVTEIVTSRRDVTSKSDMNEFSIESPEVTELIVSSKGENDSANGVPQDAITEEGDDCDNIMQEANISEKAEIEFKSETGACSDDDLFADDDVDEDLKEASARLSLSIRTEKTFSSTNRSDQRPEGACESLQGGQKSPDLELSEKESSPLPPPSKASSQGGGGSCQEQKDDEEEALILGSQDSNRSLFDCELPSINEGRSPEFSHHSLCEEGNVSSMSPCPVAEELEEEHDILMASPPREAHEKASTPVKDYQPEEIVTPLPEYDKMETPVLKQELRKFGLKAIPKRKAIPLLKHIYYETHPSSSQAPNQIEESADRPEEEVEEGLSNSQDSTTSSNGCDLPEESMFCQDEAGESDEMIAGPSTQAAQLTQTDVSKLLLDYIKSQPSLYRQVLTYDPIWLEPFFADLKEAVPQLKKVKLNQIMDIFDTECITFRTASQAASRARKRERAAGASSSQAAVKRTQKPKSSRK